MLLKRNLNYILINFDMNFTFKGTDTLTKVVDERAINYKNLFFKTGDPIIKNFDFFKRFGTLYDLLIDLLNEKINTLEQKKERKEMKEKINKLGNFVLLEESIMKKKTKSGIKKTQNKTRRNQILAPQKSVIEIAIKLYDKITIIINAFVNNSIYFRDVEKDVYYRPGKSEPEFEESIAKKKHKERRQKIQDEKNQQEEGLKILTSDQMLSRLIYINHIEYNYIQLLKRLIKSTKAR